MTIALNLLRSAKPKELRFLNGAFGTFSGSTSLTYSNIDIGTPRADRIVIVMFSMSGGTSTYFTASTIAGNSANSRARRTVNAFTQHAFFSLKVANGTTASIVATTNSSNSNNCWLKVYAAYGYNDENWTGDATGTASTATSPTLSGTVTGISNGAILAGYRAENWTSGASRVWTNVTDDSVEQGTYVITTAKNMNPTAGSQSIQFTSNDSSVRYPAFAAIAFS